jgi:hypothetical protein
MSLLDEKRRIVDFVTFEKPRVFATISGSNADPAVRQSLTRLGKQIFDVIETSLPARLDAVILDEGELLPDIASSTLRSLLTGLQGTLALLSSVAEQQRTIPRELYRYVDWFFAQAGFTRMNRPGGPPSSLSRLLPLTAARQPAHA